MTAKAAILKTKEQSVMKTIDRLPDAATLDARLMNEMIQALKDFKDLVNQKQFSDMLATHPNPLNRCGRKCFSQADEDGITLEIIQRMGLETGLYAEFGVGSGLENNTLILASLGWRGFWVGAQDLAFDQQNSTKHTFIKEWITLDNVCGLAKQGSDYFGQEDIDVISLKLDGNDIYFARRLLENGFLPKLFVVEYNAKFPPPVLFQIKYDPDQHWTGDDYFGASLCSFDALFSSFGYRLVCCNAQTGVSAFFVKDEYSDTFTDVPTDINALYVEPRYHLYEKYGRPPSTKVVEKILSDNHL